MLSALGAAGLVSVQALLLGCSDKVAEPDPPPKPAVASAKTSVADPSELGIEDLSVGTGDRAVKEGDTIRVHYVGRLLRTKAKFDENTVKEEPFEFTVGEGVIEGWSQGVVGMKRGGKRRLTIPSKLAYGEAGSPPKIPGNAPLVFEIDLVGWKGDPDPAPSASASASASAAASAAASADEKPRSDKPQEPAK